MTTMRDMQRRAEVYKRLGGDGDVLVGEVVRLESEVAHLQAALREAEALIPRWRNGAAEYGITWGTTEAGVVMGQLADELAAALTTTPGEPTEEHLTELHVMYPTGEGDEADRARLRRHGAAHAAPTPGEDEPE